MNKHSSWSFALLLGSLLCSGAVIAKDESSFTAEQREDIGKVAAQYLVDHPEFLMDAAQNLKKQQDDALQEKRAAGILKKISSLLHDPSTPVAGAPNGSVSVVEFFDYQCIYCAKSFPVLDAVMKKQPQVRYVFKEFPIFGSNWPASVQAAEMGLAIWKTQGSEAYLKYHDGIYATGHNEGKLTQDDIKQVMQKNGIAVPAPQIVKDMAAAIKSTQDLAQELGVQGTPMFMVMPTTGASKSTISVLPGLVTEDVLTAAIVKAAAPK